jgi:hypothetical protein
VADLTGFGKIKFIILLAAQRSYILTPHNKPTLLLVRISTGFSMALEATGHWPYFWGILNDANRIERFTLGQTASPA